MPRVAFTAKTRKYLGSLDAVESVTQYRICYSKEFRDDCMRRYAEGGSPAAIFREAGLDPKDHRIQARGTLHRSLEGGKCGKGR